MYYCLFVTFKTPVFHPEIAFKGISLRSKPFYPFEIPDKDTKKMILKRFRGEKSHYFSIICILTKQKSWHIICYY